MTGYEYIKQKAMEEFEQKIARFKTTECPHEVGLRDADDCTNMTCDECWKKALESEVSENE